LPPEIEKDITFIDNPLPDCEELRHIFEGVLDSISDSGTKVTAPKQEELISAALGLTPLEAENAFAYAYVKHKTFDEHALITVQELKTSFINKSGVLEFVPRQYDLDDIGGLATLKEWLSLRKLAFTPEAKEFGLSTPKGVLLAGVPGAGKSLSAKALSAAWELPLLRFDVGKVFHSLVGESEQKMREALLMAEAMSPCILWIDEIEKAFSGTTNGGDGGVTSRIFGQFLTWMQEKTAPVFIFATANHIHSLPPEFLRKGRFDEFFFVDLPDEEERHVILNIHFAKKKRNPSDFDLELLVRESDGFSGAELESCISQSLFKAFSQNRDVVTLDVLSTMQSTTPLSETMKEHIDALRKWAKERAKPASKTKSNFDSAVVDFQKKKSSN
jgi:SpoVK/Ycf46/Vps4 family AAA+-type ATPase